MEQAVDNCPADANADQTDADGDGIGDDCDPTPFPPDPPTPPDPPARADPPVPADPPAPAPPAGPADTSVSLDLTGKKKVKAAKAIKLEASCAEEACQVSAQATFEIPGTAVFGAAAAKSKKLKTKALTASLVGGATETLRLRLKPGPKRKLKRLTRSRPLRKQVKVIAGAAAIDAAGNRDRAKLRLELR